jgi:hypothetical protein
VAFLIFHKVKGYCDHMAFEELPDGPFIRACGFKQSKEHCASAQASGIRKAHWGCMDDYVACQSFGPGGYIHACAYILCIVVMYRVGGVFLHLHLEPALDELGCSLRSEGKPSLGGFLIAWKPYCESAPS